MYPDLDPIPDPDPDPVPDPDPDPVTDVLTIKNQIGHVMFMIKCFSL